MKMRLFAVVLLSALGLSGCSAAPQEPSAPGLYLAPAELTEEERNIADLLGADANQPIYDFYLDGSVQSMQVNTYELSGGAWRLVHGGGGQQFTDARGRLALAFDRLTDGLRIAVQSEHNSGATTIKKGAVDEASELGAAASILSDRTEIVYGEEIPLVVQIITAKSEIPSPSVEQFAHPEEYARLGYEHVYAITVRFSREPVA